MAFDSAEGIYDDILHSWNYISLNVDTVIISKLKFRSGQAELLRVKILLELGEA